MRVSRFEKNWIILIKFCVIITDTQDIHHQSNIVINRILHHYIMILLFEDSLVMIVRHRLSLRRTGNNVFSALNGSASNHNNTYHCAVVSS